MSFFDIFPTFAEAPYSYIIVPLILGSSIYGFYNKPYFYALLLHPYEIYRGKRWHTLLTSAFVHRNWMHLFSNLIVIYGLTYDMFGNINQELGSYYAYILTPSVLFLLITLPNIIQTIAKREDFIFTAVGSSGLSFGLYSFSGLFFPLQKMSSFLFPFVHNAFHSWLIGLIILVILCIINRDRFINTRLHLSGYLCGAVICLLISPESAVEIIQSIFKMQTP